MVWEARLRSQMPMSQSEFKPRRARCIEVFVGNLIEAVDGAAVFSGELGEPDIGALGDQHGGGHPGDIGAELFVLVGGIAEDRDLGVAGHAGPLLGAAFTAAAGGFFGGLGGGGTGGGLGFGVGRMEAHPDRQFLFVQDVSGDQQKAFKTFAEQRLPLACGSRKAARSTSRERRRRGRGADQRDSPARRLRSGTSGRVAK